ncbi:MAG: efflux RND transporter periplasmic adaptor subunit [Candidatus Hydrogenedentota bacterium]
MRKLRSVGAPLIIVIAIIAGAMLLVWSKKAQLEQTPAFSDRPRPTTVTTAQAGELTVAREYLAVVEPFEEARLSAQVTADVTSAPVDEGDRVEAGDVLLELDAEEMEHKIAVNEARAEEAAAELAGNEATVEALVESNQFWQAEKQRDQQLAADESIPGTQAEQTAQKAAEVKGNLEAGRQKSHAIRSQMEALDSELAELQTRRNYYTITSPSAGVVTQRTVDPGDQAAPGKTLVEVQDRRRLKLAFDVPQQDLPEIQQGLDVNFVANGVSRTAEISLLYPALNQAKMMRAEVWLDRDAGPVPSTGAYAPLEVVVKRVRDGVLLPAAALIEGPNGASHVFAVEDGRLVARQVEILGRTGDTASVKGISSGDRVVRNTFLGWATLSSGENVEPIE